MFAFVKEIFISAVMFFGCTLPSVSSLTCISTTNQECKVRPQFVMSYLLKAMSFNDVAVIYVKGSACRI